MCNAVRSGRGGTAPCGITSGLGYFFIDCKTKAGFVDTADRICTLDHWSWSNRLSSNRPEESLSSVQEFSEELQIMKQIMPAVIFAEPEHQGGLLNLWPLVQGHHSFGRSIVF
jgi:hypothetical protein